MRAWSPMQSDTPAAIVACVYAPKWSYALVLLSIMRCGAVEPSTISFSAAISVCENASEWTFALELLSCMRREGVEAATIYSTQP